MLTSFLKEYFMKPKSSVIKEKCIAFYLLLVYLQQNNWFELDRFYGTSTIVGYLMPNPFLYI